MTKVELIAAVAEKANLTKKDAEAAVNGALDVITESLKGGDKVTLVGFGTFEVRERPERKGRNPQTGAEITIEASKLPAFKAGPEGRCSVSYPKVLHPVASARGAFLVNKKEKNLMRLDKYLKVSRLIKRRTLANEVADAGRVMVNDKPAKASYAVKVGDVIEITFGNRPVKVRVLAVEEPKGKDVARELFEVIE